MYKERPGTNGPRWTGMFFSKAMTFDEEDAIRSVSEKPARPAGITADSSFIDKLRARDAAAFEALVERHSADVHSVAFRLTGDAEEASDITQETFLQVFKSIDRFRGDASLKTWLVRIAINRSRNRFRWWKRRRRDRTTSLDDTIGSSEMTLGDTLSDRSPSPEADALRGEREAALMKALRSIKSDFREVVVLADIEGLSYEECAAALGIGLGTVKSRLSRGRSELKLRLKDL